MDEQTRQTEDPPFRDTLLRARSGSLTGNDLSFLNSKAITSLADPQLEVATTVVKRNVIRHLVNRIQIEKFARFRSRESMSIPRTTPARNPQAQETYVFTQMTYFNNPTKEPRFRFLGPSSTQPVCPPSSCPSPDLFGGLPVVIFIGDFFQFPSVRGPAVWKDPRKGAVDEENGRLIWCQFKQVIFLDEQMRLSEDAPFRDLPSRARTWTLTDADRSVLNSKTVTSLTSPQLEDVTTVVKVNSMRHQVNRTRIEPFARTRCQNVYIFPALHTWTRPTGPINLRLRASDLLQQPNQGIKMPFLGLFLYTPTIPAVILTNICTLLGLVNGTAGTSVGIVVDPTSGLIFRKQS